MALDEVAKKILRRCQGSPSYFLDTFAKINHPKLGIIPFKLFSYQQKCLKEFLKNRFTIFKKTRQCLAEGTIIYTPNGPKKIEDLKIGDIIYSYKDGKVVESAVSNHFETGIRECIKISTENKDIICTPDHKFLINDKWVRADELKIKVDSFTMPFGDELSEVSNKFGLIKKIEPAGKHCVFDITVDNTHCMVANGFVTHNCGVSTISGGFALWYAMFSSNKNILIVSKRDDDSKEFLNKNVKTIYNNLPEWMQNLWPLTSSNEHEIVFANNSRIKSLTSSKDTLRSQAASLNIIDEAAFCPEMDIMWSGGWSTISHGGSVIVISTVSGVGTWYWQTWTDAEAGLNDFKPIVINWWDMDWKLSFVDELSGKNTIIAPTDSMRKCEVQEEIDKYGQYWSPWLEEQYRNLTQKGDPRKFYQEVLAQFIGSGNTVLGRPALVHIQNNIQESSKEYRTIAEVDYVNPTTDEPSILNFEDKLWIWKTPYHGSNKQGDDSHIYSVGVDTSSGDGNDFSAIQVIDISTQEQVAELQIRTLPRTLSMMADYIARWYNNAFMVVERTGIGSTICQDLAEMLLYQNLYRRPKKNMYNKESKYGDVGFNTSVTTKPLLNKVLIDHIGEEGITIRSPRLYKEFTIYVHLRGGRTGAEPGKGNTDDLVMSFALALIGMNQAVSIDNTALKPVQGSINPALHNPVVVQQKLQKMMTDNNLLLPTAIPLDINSSPTISQEISKFTKQLVSLPKSNVVNIKNHIIRKKK